MKRNLVTFITVSIFICGLAGFFIWGLTSLLFAVDYPEKNELRYEECTFIGYENVRDRGTRYYIFVNEYDEPLEIDNIVSSSVSESLLRDISSGDKITVSIDQSDKDLYSMYCGDINILSYDDYLSEHEPNNALGVVLLTLFSCLMLGLLVVEIIYYKKTGDIIGF